MYIHTIHVGGDSGSGTKNVTIEGNVVYNSPQGIEIKSESGTQTLLSENITIKNNIFPAQVIVSNTCPVRDIFIYNNLIHSTNNQNALLYFNSPNPVNVQIKNNIFYKTTANANHALVSVLSTTGLTGVTFDHNLYYFPVASGNILRVGNNNYSTLTSFKTAFPIQELNGQQGNPNFVSAPGDFHLTSASTLAIDKGANVTGVVHLDIEGMPRPIDGDGVNGASWDIGPYEYCCFIVGTTTLDNDNEINIYPNPATDEITIEFLEHTPDKIIISDISGKMAMEIHSTSLQNKFNIKQLTSGIYFVKAYVKSEIRSSKILLIK